MVDPAYIVRVWVPASKMTLEVMAAAAAAVAARSPHVHVLGVTPAGEDVIARYRVLAYGVRELFAILAECAAAAEQFGVEKGTAHRVSITLDDHTDAG